MHRCQIFRMERSKDDAMLHFTCIHTTDITCWDMLKFGRCPRPGCTWAHPVPILISVSCAGDPGEQQAARATMMAKVPTMANAPDDIKSNESVAIPPSRSSVLDTNSVNITA